MQWWMSQTFSSPLFIFGNQGRPAGLNVTQLNKAWWNTLLHVWSQDLYVISAGRKNDSTLNIPCLELTQTLAMMLAGLLFNGINKGNWRSWGRLLCVWLAVQILPHIVPVCTDLSNLFDSAAVEARHVHNLCISVCTCECAHACKRVQALMQASPAVSPATSSWVGFARVPSDLFFFLLLIASHLIADSRGRERMLHKSTAPSDILAGIWLFSRTIEKSVLPCVTFICNACCCPLDFLLNV